MKIENNGSDQLSQVSSTDARKVEKAGDDNAVQNTSAPRGKDEASLSARAKLLAKARANLEEVPEVRADRVDKFREQILDGTYEVPYEQLADLLIEYLGIGE